MPQGSTELGLVTKTVVNAVTQFQAMGLLESTFNISVLTLICLQHCVASLRYRWQRLPGKTGFCTLASRRCRAGHLSPPTAFDSLVHLCQRDPVSVDNKLDQSKV